MPLQQSWQEMHRKFTVYFLHHTPYVCQFLVISLYAQSLLNLCTNDGGYLKKRKKNPNTHPVKEKAFELF